MPPYESPKLTEGQTKNDLLLFCVGCFATEEGGSWGEICVDGYCMNCGSGGGTVQLKRWQIESIRTSASWVGKRYYPHQEDINNYREIQLLRARVPPNPSDKVDFYPADPKQGLEHSFWSCERSYGEEGLSSVTVTLRHAPGLTRSRVHKILNKSLRYTEYVPPKKGKTDERQGHSHGHSKSRRGPPLSTANRSRKA